MIKYLHVDGRGCVWNGPAEELAAKDFVAQIFGTLDAPLGLDEQINPIDGSVEKIPQTEEQAAAETEKQDILALLTELDAGTATASEVQGALAYVVRKITA